MWPSRGAARPADCSWWRGRRSLGPCALRYYRGTHTERVQPESALIDVIGRQVQRWMRLGELINAKMAIRAAVVVHGRVLSRT